MILTSPVGHARCRRRVSSPGLLRNTCQKWRSPWPSARRCDSPQAGRSRFRHLADVPRIEGLTGLHFVVYTRPERTTSVSTIEMCCHCQPCQAVTRNGSLETSIESASTFCTCRQWLSQSVPVLLRFACERSPEVSETLKHSRRSDTMAIFKTTRFIATRGQPSLQWQELDRKQAFLDSYIVHCC